MNFSIRAFFSALFIILFITANSQIAHQPGKIVRTARTAAGRKILDPNGDGWVSFSGAAWAINANDTSSSASEIRYGAISTYGGEPCCDLRRGPDHKFTDFVPDANNNGVYLSFVDTATVTASSDATKFLRIRMRMGTIIPGSKGFSLLIDTDSAYGATGSRRDPNYVAQTTGINGNRGFEIEVVLETGFRVAIYNIDGKGNPSDHIDIQDMTTSPWLIFYDNDWEARSQVSFAATTESGDADYFIDWFVSLAELKLMKVSNGGSSFIQSSSQSLRFIPTTVMAPKPSTAGPISDIYGGGDSASISWMPPACLSCAKDTICTAAPVITIDTLSGTTTTIKGTWTAAAGGSTTATITLYKNGNTTAFQTISNISSGATWGPVTTTTLAVGDTVTAKAQGTGKESKYCFTSGYSRVSSCSSRPSPLTVTGADNKGITGTGYTLGDFISIWKIQASGLTPIGTQPRTTVTTTSAADAYNYTGSADGNGKYSWSFSKGAGTGAPNAVMPGSYYVVDSSAAGCVSGTIFICQSSATTGSGATAYGGLTKVPTLTQVVTDTTTIVSGGFYSNSGTGATLAPTSVRIYYDSVQVGSVVTDGSTWSYTFNRILTAGKRIRIRAQSGSTATCASDTSAVIGSPACSNKAAIFNIDSSSSKIAEGVIVSGQGTAGGTVIVRKQPANTQVATATVGSDGTWTTSYTAASADVSYNATLTTSGCATAATASTVLVASKTTETYCNGTLDFSANTLSNTGYSTVISSGVATGTKLTSDARWLQGSLGGSVSANTKTVKIYLNDGIIAYYSIGASSNAWGPIAVDSMLSQGDILTIAVTENNGSSAEMVCASTRIICDCAVNNKPTRPVLSNGSTTQVASGNKATLILNNPQDNNLYSVKNYYTGKALSRGIYYTGGNIVANAKGLGNGETLTIDQISVDSNQVVQVDAHRIGGTETCTDSLSFELKIIQILPVSITEFKGVQGDKKNMLSWKTANEIDFAFFDLEKSTDGNNFSAIAKINANGFASSYSYQDNNITNKVNYYRLKMVDINGRFKYSNIIVLTETGSSIVLNTIRPNPFVNRVVISLNLMKAQDVSMVLVDAAGHQVNTTKTKAEKGYNDIWLNNLSELPKGMYILKIYADGNVYREKLVKVN